MMSLHEDNPISLLFAHQFNTGVDEPVVHTEFVADQLTTYILLHGTKCL